jgi:transcriptional regulator with PAS, ATPase and Fis domain
MVGKSPEMVSIYRMIGKASLSTGNVLILGESGTGKELVARAIHDNSVRAKNNFVAINCCALAENLLESELFGHVKGAFTGAINNKRGLFEEASGGTLFLDEIGDLSQAMQVKLLRAIQEGEIRPVGANENRKVDVRIIAATHRNLKSYLAEGKFREDLFYRLKVFLIEMPALRERTGDIAHLVEYFVARSAAKAGKNVSGVCDKALAALTAYSWPGNIRELENSIERAVSLSNTSVLYAEDFSQEIASGAAPVTPAIEESPHQAAPAPVEAARHGTVSSLEEMEHGHIVKVLENVNFNKTKAAELLGIDRTTLYRKASRYGIDLEAVRDPAV